MVVTALHAESNISVLGNDQTGRVRDLLMSHSCEAIVSTFNSEDFFDEIIEVVKFIKNFVAESFRELIKGVFTIFEHKFIDFRFDF